jgi:hypothetical protein
MVEFALKSLLAIFGFLVVMGAWYAIQMYVRFKSRCGQDRDLLEFMAHGCGGCKDAASCPKNQMDAAPMGAGSEEHHNESVRS